MTASPILLASLPESELAVRRGGGRLRLPLQRRGIDGVLAEIQPWLAATKQRHQREA